MLKDILQEKNITQERLAKELGVSQQSISQYCNKGISKIETAKKIAKILNVPIEKIISM